VSRGRDRWRTCGSGKASPRCMARLRGVAEWALPPLAAVRVLPAAPAWKLGPPSLRGRLSPRSYNPVFDSPIYSCWVHFTESSGTHWW
jgi:hypothetical protein